MCLDTASLLSITEENAPFLMNLVVLYWRAFHPIASGLKELILVNIIGNPEVKRAVGTHIYLLIVERLQH